MQRLQPENFRFFFAVPTALLSTSLCNSAHLRSARSCDVSRGGSFLEAWMGLLLLPLPSSLALSIRVKSSVLTPFPMAPSLCLRGVVTGLGISGEGDRVDCGGGVFALALPPMRPSPLRSGGGRGGEVAEGPFRWSSVSFPSEAVSESASTTSLLFPGDR